MSPKKPASHKPRFVDIGFDNGELLGRVARAGRYVAEGVEAGIKWKNRVEIPGAKLSYGGFEGWLKKAEPNSCKIVNMGLFLGSYVNNIARKRTKLALGKKLKDSMFAVGSVEFENREARFLYENEGKIRKRVLQGVFKKLQNGGIVRLVVRYGHSPKIEILLKDAGFENVRTMKMKESQFNTSWEKREADDGFGGGLFIVTGRKPKT